MEVTKALKFFIKKQASKLGKMHGKISKVRVYVENVARRDSDPNRAEVRYKVELPGKDIVVKRRATDLYEAIVDATDSVVRQVRKMKEKRITKQRRSKTIKQNISELNDKLNR